VGFAAVSGFGLGVVMAESEAGAAATGWGGARAAGVGKARVVAAVLAGVVVGGQEAVQLQAGGDGERPARRPALQVLLPRSSTSSALDRDVEDEETKRGRPAVCGRAFGSVRWSGDI